MWLYNSQDMALDSNEQTTNYMGVAEPLHAVLIAETCT